MMHMLKFQKHEHTRGNNETRQGSFIYSGSYYQFFDWEFRAMLKYHSCKEADRGPMVAKVIDGLRGDAFEKILRMYDPKDLIEDPDGLLNNQVHQRKPVPIPSGRS